MFPLVICWFCWARPPTGHFIKVTLQPQTVTSDVVTLYTAHYQARWDWLSLKSILRPSLSRYCCSNWSFSWTINFYNMDGFINSRLMGGPWLWAMRPELNTDNNETCYFNIPSFCVMRHGNALIQGLWLLTEDRWGHTHAAIFPDD